MSFKLLAKQSALEAFAARALTSTLGQSVLFYNLSIGLYQKSMRLIAVQAQGFLNEAMIAEMTATGGIIIIGLGVGSLLELKPIRTGNLLPGLLIAPLIVKGLEWAGPLLPTLSTG
jgi:uncharacterized membrane protein YqgA involved in biofilm formation